jgi:hypothetical protein
VFSKNRDRPPEGDIAGKFLAAVPAQPKVKKQAKADAADKKVRAETAAEIDRLTSELMKVGAEFNDVAARLSEHTATAVAIVYEALELDRFMATCLTEIPAALELVPRCYVRIPVR